MIDLFSLFSTFNPLLIVKLLLLLLMLVYTIFAVIVLVQARAFHRILYIGDSFGSFFIQLLAILHLVVTISLFLLALAIL